MRCSASSLTGMGTAVDSELAVTGKFRVGMNANNATLVIRRADGTVSGLSADLGHFIAGRLGVPFEPILYPAAAQYTASFGKTEWDIILTGKNDVVAKLVDFCADLFLIEYMYIAAPGRAFRDPAEVDAAGVRIAVPRNASADVFLSRTLASAELVRVDGDRNVGIELLRTGKADVYATGSGNVQAMAQRMPEATIVGVFSTVTFSVAARKGLSAAAQGKLTALVNEAKAAGIVEQGLAQAGARDVRIVA